jgi:hypothetical protein
VNVVMRAVRRASRVGGPSERGPSLPSMISIEAANPNALVVVTSVRGQVSTTGSVLLGQSVSFACRSTGACLPSGEAALTSRGWAVPWEYVTLTRVPEPRRVSVETMRRQVEEPGVNPGRSRHCDRAAGHCGAGSQELRPAHTAYPGRGHPERSRAAP